MNDIIPFKYSGKPVRVVTIDGDPWWVAKDVCDVLGISKHRDALSRLDDDERGSVTLDTPGGSQKTGAINEAGLYTLILRSQKPEAKLFKRWITHSVIPQIRKTGSFLPDIPKTYPDALRKYADVLETLEKQKPAVEFYKAVTDSRDAIPMGDVAKVLDMGMGRNKLFSFLRNNGVLMKDNIPYQEYIDKGWFRVVEQKFTKADGSIGINIKTLVFQRGLDGIRRLIIKHKSIEVA